VGGVVGTRSTVWSDLLDHNDDVRKFSQSISWKIGDSNMPNVGGKKYPYTAKGRAAAAKAKAKRKAKPKRRGR
tara:strand:- start:298 stop:516 length:219 start_codon:yes stop_codon:yes gene_type:complete